VLLVAVTVASCSPPTINSPHGVTVWMDATYSGGFFSLPWPNDIRKTNAGTLDLTGFPGTDSSLELLVAASLMSNELRGFGTQTAVYLRLTGRIDPATLPTPERSTTSNSSVQLIDLDHPSTRIPVIVRVEPTDGGRPSNLLSLLPYPGHALAPDTRYAAVVTTGVHDTVGEPLAQAPLIAALDEAAWLGRARSERDWRALRSQRDEVRAAIGTDSSNSLVAFTVFRTQDSTREMRGGAAPIDAAPAPAINLQWPPCTPTDTAVTAYGTIDLPDFQSGTYPFVSSGGAIPIGTDGVAIVHGQRSYPLIVRIPCAETPPGGWPIETFVDGTGASANLVNAIGFVPDAIAASIPPLFGQGTGVSDPSSEANFYNSLNPQAARGNPIQQAANHLALIKALQHVNLPGASFGSVAAVTADTSRVMISGQSQGAQTLPLVAAMNPHVIAVVSGAGVAGFYNVISYRSSAREQLGHYAGIDDLDIRNPLVQLIDTLEDNAEPANYPNDAHQLNFAGKIDGCVPLEASRHLDAAMKLTVSDPQWGSILGSPTLDPPTTTGSVSANVNGRTKVSVEAPGGHFIAYSNLSLASDFTAAAFAGTAPTVAAGPFGSNDGNCEPRWGTIGSGS